MNAIASIETKKVRPGGLFRNMGWEEQSFREKIEQEHTFPCSYMFKFIVPGDQQQALLDVLPDGNVSFRESSAGKYISVTLERRVADSDEVINIYRNAHSIEGIIAL